MSTRPLWFRGQGTGGEDYQEAAALTTHNNGVPSAEHFKPSDEVRVGESGLVLPKEVLNLKVLCVCRSDVISVGFADGDAMPV